MLTGFSEDNYLFIYPISRDLGFAPNPFHGVCTLATCKPKIRKNAKINDWVMGIAGKNIKEKQHQCIFLMKVTDVLTFDEYWNDPRFSLKKPIRNGSMVQMLGDNIYHRDHNGNWIQEDSHHSKPSGEVNHINLHRDTGSTENVLVSNLYIYFGQESKPVDLEKLNYGRIRNYRKIQINQNQYAQKLILDFLKNKNIINTIVDDPFHFELFDRRVDQESGNYV